MKLPTEMVKLFFKFMRERESIRIKKENGEPWPWTRDAILSTYSFTNVKRELDYTSQQLIRLLYRPNYEAPREECLLNCAIARYFGTWEFMEDLGWQEDFEPEYIKDLAHYRIDHGNKVWTGAYVISSGNMSGDKVVTVVDHFLAGLWKDRKALTLKYREWKPFVEDLMRLKGFGGSGFMSKEVALDTRYTSFWRRQPQDKNTWTPVGPGSKRGAGWVMGHRDNKRLDNKTTLEVCRELFAMHEEYWPEEYVDLELTDIQFQLCEFAKYQRTHHGMGRPKKKYEPRQGKLL